jgi:colanic acid/amylovoran biosynthesis glycosyltransferase
MNNVLIFRHQLFKVSEPFITQQAEHLTRFRPIYLGRNRFGNAPAGALSFALEDIPRQRHFSRRLWQVLTGDPHPYINLISIHRPSLIHAHFGVEGVYALPLARKLGVPLVTTFHGFDATTTTGALIRSGLPSWIHYALSRQQLARMGDLFLCVSDYIRQRVIGMGFPQERTHVHYIGIDTEAIQPRQSDEESPIVLHVARLVEKKGTEYLIRAFTQMASKVPDVELVIIGEGAFRATLEAQTRALGMEARIFFMGARPHSEVMAMMRKAAVLVLPSVTARTGDAEGLGMVLLEAAALGVPLIGTRHGGISEVIVDGQTGYLVPEREVNMIAVRMHELLSDDALRRRMGSRARSLMESRFNIRKQIGRLEKFYESVVIRSGCSHAMVGPRHNTRE